MVDRLQALAFNELSAALGEVDRFVALTERMEIARRVVIVMREEISRKTAERVLLVSEVTRGLRCPECHGKPATHPHPLETDPEYRCGAGHVWRRPLVTSAPSAHLEVLLQAVAETGELPPVPDRIERGAR